MSIQKGLKTKVGEWEYHLHSGNSNVGVVLVHEIFGLTDYVESVAAQLSQKGFWAAAVDLFRGKFASNLEEGYRLRASLKQNEVLDALSTGLELLKERIGSSAKIGSMGFCMGGGLALLGACNLDMAFCVDYYGSIEDLEQLKGVRGAILVFLGSEDERVTPWAYQNLLPAAMKYKKRVDLHLYPNASHAFHRPGWEGYDAAAAKDAWSKTLNFLSQFQQA